MPSCAFDASLLESRLLAAAKPGTLIVVNSSKTAEQFSHELPGYRVIPVDGLSISRRHGLGRIVNSALLGALACEHRGAADQPAQPRDHRRGAEAARRQHRGMRRGLPLRGSAAATSRRMSARDPVPTVPVLNTSVVPVVQVDGDGARMCRGRAERQGHAACPVGGDIAEWIGRARARDFRGAWEILTPQPFSGARRTRLPPPLRIRLQSRRFRRLAGDLSAGALCRRSRARGAVGHSRRSTPRGRSASPS